MNTLRRHLSLAFASFIAIVLVVGGVSLYLAVQIHRTNRIVDQENAHIMSVAQIQWIFNEIITDLDEVEDTGQFNRIERVLPYHENLRKQLTASRTRHRGEEDKQELALLSDLANLAEELQAVTNRLEAAPVNSRDLALRDLARLNVLSKETSAKTVEFGNIHRLKITSLLQRGDGMLRAVVGLYLAFVLVSAGLLAFTTIGFRRSIVVPLEKLSDAAAGIAEGSLDRRIPVRSPDEIGQVSRAFNVMADRLQISERDLRVADGQLEQKTRETQALLQISTEISDLRELNRILQSVAEKACELLHGEAAAICLLTPGEEQLVVRATSGPPHAFRSRNHLTPWSVVAGDATAAHNGDCPAMRPEYLRAHLAAPLRRGTGEIGVICVSGHVAREFTAKNTELLTGLATQAVIAIENSRLYEEVRSLAMLEERDRLARELHDGLAQTLGLLHMKLDRAQDQALSADFPQMADALLELMAITDRAYEDLRQSMFGLRIKMPGELGFILSLTKYLGEFSSQSGIPVVLEVADGRPVGLSPASELQLVRIIQEALANVRKHAEAGRAWVRLHRQDAWIRVTIEDDGRGFDPTIVSSPIRRAFGLQMMRERAEAAGGKLQIDSVRGHGTRIVATLPEGA